MHKRQQKAMLTRLPMTGFLGLELARPANNMWCRKDAGRVSFTLGRVGVVASHGKLSIWSSRALQ